MCEHDIHLAWRQSLDAAKGEALLEIIPRCAKCGCSFVMENAGIGIRDGHLWVFVRDGEYVPEDVELARFNRN